MSFLSSFLLSVVFVRVHNQFKHRWKKTTRNLKNDTFLEIGHFAISRNVSFFQILCRFFFSWVMFIQLFAGNDRRNNGHKEKRCQFARIVSVRQYGSCVVSKKTVAKNDDKNDIWRIGSFTYSRILNGNKKLHKHFDHFHEKWLPLHCY